MNKIKMLKWLIALALIALAIYLVANEGVDSTGEFGSVTGGNEYHATTTPTGNESWSDRTLKVGQGALGSVIVTKAGSIDFVLYNATSTGAVANDSRFNKSLKQLARIPENLAAGTYTFDVTFTDGLVMDVLQGTTGTSTITFR